MSTLESSQSTLLRRAKINRVLGTTNVTVNPQRNE